MQALEGSDTPRYRTRTYLLMSGLSLLLLFLFLHHFFGFFAGLDTASADIKNDWVVATALLDGQSPYSDLTVLSEKYAQGSYVPPQVLDGTGTVVTPRTPGAIVLSVPWTLLPIHQIAQVNNLIAVFSLIPMVGLVVWQRHNPLWLLLSIGIVFSSAMVWNLGFSAVSSLVALTTTYSVVSMSKSDSIASGISIAVAATLKAFPGILFFVAIAAKRYKTATAAFVAFAVVNLGPILLPTVSFGDSLRAVLGAGSRFGFLDSNMSMTYLASELLGSWIALALMIGVVTAVLYWIFRTEPTPVLDSVIVLCLAVLVAPLSWPHYGLLVYPLVVVLFVHRQANPLSTSLAVGGLILGYPSDSPWPTALGIALIMVSAIVVKTDFNPLRRLPSARVSTR